MMARVPRMARLNLLRALALTVLLLAAAVPAHAISYGPGDSHSEDAAGFRKITGGSRISVTAAPWQVRLDVDTTGICGGSIIDPLHIVTAAHCTYNGLSALPASKIKVISGSSSFNTNSGAPNGSGSDSPITSTVASVRRHPAFIATSDGRTDSRQGRGDVAVLTLTSPLPLDGVVRQAIALPARNSELALDSPLSVTGFGLQSETTGSLDGRLYRLTDIRLLDAVSRVGEWNAVYLTATSPTGLDCSGDSGGPLVTGSGPSAVLVGLVAFSPDCQAGTASVFTKTSPGEVRDFITGSDSPPRAPTGGRDILLTADKSGALPLNPGRVLTCFPGTWTNSPTITITFSSTAGEVLQEGSSRRYKIATADIGRRIGCHAVARNDGGVGRTPPTGTPPPIEQAVSGSTSARLTVSLRSSTDYVFRRDAVTISMRMYSRNTRAAKNAQSCLTLPKGWRVLRRGLAKVYGSSVCRKTRWLAKGKYLITNVALVPNSRARKGLTSLRVRAKADNSKAAFYTRKLRVY
jgi:hypothetical protein